MDDVSAGFITQGAKRANRSFLSFSQNSEDCCKLLILERLSKNRVSIDPHPSEPDVIRRRFFQRGRGDGAAGNSSRALRVSQCL